MNFLALQNDFKAKAFGHAQSETAVTLTDIKAYINRAYLKICRRLAADPKLAAENFLKHDQTLTITGGLLTMSSARVVDIAYLQDASAVKISPRTLEHIRQYQDTGYYKAGKDTAGKQQIAVRVLGKAPADGTAYTADFIQLPADMSADADLPVIDEVLHEAISYFAAAEYMQTLGQPYQNEVSKYLQLGEKRFSEAVEDMGFQDEPEFIGE